MKYRQKVEKKAPTPGELFGLEPDEVSAVDSPANGKKFLIKKRKAGMKKELIKKFKDAGIAVDNFDIPEDKEAAKPNIRYSLPAGKQNRGAQSETNIHHHLPQAMRPEG